MWSVTKIWIFNLIVSDISTHTLTWSVTASAEYCLATSSDFNSHAHVERDEIPAYNTHQNMDFNSHAHVERDT